MKEMNYVLGNWSFVILHDEDKADYWLSANYQAEAAETEADVDPDVGWASDWHENMTEAAKKVINFVWRDNLSGGLDKVAQMIAAMVMLGIIPANVQIDDTTAVIDGRLYFGSADPDRPERNGIEPWNSMKRLTINDFHGEGKRLAAKILKAAEQEANEWNEQYNHWEASWMDGPQW